MNPLAHIAIRILPDQSGDNNLSGMLAEDLVSGQVALDTLHTKYPHALPGLYREIQRLWSLRAIGLINDETDPDIFLTPGIHGDVLKLAAPDDAAAWKLSRFAFFRRDEDSFKVESPRSCCKLVVLNPRFTALLFELAHPSASIRLMERCGWLESEDQLNSLLALLSMAAIVEPCDQAGLSPEDISGDLMTWEFHDLLFHHRTRLGRHEEPTGAHFRMKGKLPFPPVVRHSTWTAKPIQLDPGATIPLAEIPFYHVLESRRSIRKHNVLQPITARMLGAFLYRSARNKSRSKAEFGEFTSRPYPSGGASYELELYLTINHCADIPRGFYHYDPEQHQISLVQSPSKDMEELLMEAWVSSAKTCWPQILITIGSRFQRVSWKYSGIAYATQLKNTGALFQTMYLVATAMGLAACGLGLGNSSRFSRLAGTNYLAEGSVGEFALGTSGEDLGD